MQTVRFPEGYPVGQLMRVVRQQDRELWEDVAPAQGIVTISTDEQLVLLLDETTDLSPLDDFHPDALFGLSLWKIFTLRDEELRHVGRLTGLRYLALSDAWEITDVGIAHLGGLVQLEELDLTETTVTDVGLTYLRRLGKLRTLILWGTQVGDIGLRLLQDLGSLETLNLRYTKVSDQGLDALSAHTGLKLLDIKGAGFTVSGVEALQRALPHCTIESS